MYIFKKDPLPLILTHKQKSAAALLTECGGTFMREDLDYSSAKYLMVRTIWLV